MSDEVNARIVNCNGQLVLEDNTAEAVAKMAEGLNRLRSAKALCRNTLVLNQECVARFKKRKEELDLSTSEYVVVLISADDAHGRPIADILMPGTDWQAVRNSGGRPFARGFAGREFIQDVLDSFDVEAASKLRRMEGAVVVVDYGVAEAFPL